MLSFEGRRWNRVHVSSVVGLSSFENFESPGPFHREFQLYCKRTRACASSVSPLTLLERAMIEKYGKSLRIFRVFGLLFSLTIVVANADEISKNATTIANDEAAVPTSISREDKMEARSEGETLLGIEPSTRSVEWQNSGPFTRRKDSYLDALRHSRTSTDPREGIVAVDATTSSSIQRRKEQSVGPVYAGKRSEISFQTSSDRDSFSMVPSDSYSLPTRSSSDFSGFKSSYGPPRSQPPRETYGPPRETYGPPRETYGPPYHDQSSYGGEYTSVGVYPTQPQQGETRGIVLFSRTFYFHRIAHDQYHWQKIDKDRDRQYFLLRKLVLKRFMRILYVCVCMLYRTFRNCISIMIRSMMEVTVHGMNAISNIYNF